MIDCCNADLKSMVSTGLASIASCNYDLVSAANGKKTMNILCIGHGGGSLPLFLASKIQGWDVHIPFSAYAFSEELSMFTLPLLHMLFLKRY